MPMLIVALPAAGEPSEEAPPRTILFPRVITESVPELIVVVPGSCSCRSRSTGRCRPSPGSGSRPPSLPIVPA